MSRSMHSSTVYFGSPRVYRTNSSEKFSWTSVMGNRSLKTRSRPMSSRSCEAASSWSNASKARVWMSRRWGIAIPLSSSLPKEISFINSGMSHPRTGETAVAPEPFAKSREDRGVPLRWNSCGAVQREWCTQGRVEGQRARATGRRRRRDDAHRRSVGRAVLLHFDAGALLFELRLDCVRLVLRHAGLHRLRCAVDEILRFLQAEARDLTDNLDDLDLLRARILQHDRELGLLFHGCGRCGTRRSATAHRGSRDRDVELALEG